MTVDEAKKIVSDPDTHLEWTFEDYSKAKSFLEGYENGVKDSVKSVELNRVFICCNQDKCPRTEKITGDLLALLKKEEK